MFHILEQSCYHTVTESVSFLKIVTPMKTHSFDFYYSMMGCRSNLIPLSQFCKNYSVTPSPFIKLNDSTLLYIKCYS